MTGKTAAKRLHQLFILQAIILVGRAGRRRKKHNRVSGIKTRKWRKGKQLLYPDYKKYNGYPAYFKN
jgi:hypothetical protein